MDDDGQELSDDEAGRRLALACLPDMVGEKMPDGDRRTFSASVRNEHGTVLYRATLSLVGEWLVDCAQERIEPEPGSAELLRLWLAIKSEQGRDAALAGLKAIVEAQPD